MNTNSNDGLECLSAYDKSASEILMSQKEVVAILPWPHGETDLHFYLAPCADGCWHTWGENCFPGTNETFDAIYDYLDGGAYFSTREEAVREVQNWLRNFADTEQARLIEELPLPEGVTEADVILEIGADVTPMGDATEIMSLLSCTSEEASIIEDLMKTEVFHSTSDWQEREEMEIGAREAQTIFEKARTFFIRAYAIRRALFKKWRSKSEMTVKTLDYAI